MPSKIAGFTQMYRDEIDSLRSPGFVITHLTPIQFIIIHLSYGDS